MWNTRFGVQCSVALSEGFVWAVDARGGGGGSAKAPGPHFLAGCVQVQARNRLASVLCCDRILVGDLNLTGNGQEA